MPPVHAGHGPRTSACRCDCNTSCKPAASSIQQTSSTHPGWPYPHQSPERCGCKEQEWAGRCRFERRPQCAADSRLSQSQRAIPCSSGTHACLRPIGHQRRLRAIAASAGLTPGRASTDRGRLAVGRGAREAQQHETQIKHSAARWGTAAPGAPACTQSRAAVARREMRCKRGQQLQASGAVVSEHSPALRPAPARNQHAPMIIVSCNQRRVTR